MGLSRLELFQRLGRVRVVEPIADRAFREYEDKVWRGKDTGHGEPWHLSHHGSSFPGDDPRACARKLVYGLADFPESEAFSRDLRGTMIVGQAIEAHVVEKMDLAGRVLSAPAHAEIQTRFEDADHWFGVSPDMVILPPRWNRPHIVEIKSKDSDVVIAMKNGQRSYDSQHRSQLLAAICLGNEMSREIFDVAMICNKSWRLAVGDGEEEIYCPEHEDSECLDFINLQEMRTGSLYYHSRDRPRVTHEYFFELDPHFMAAGRLKLRQSKAAFENDQLPPHPFNGKEWSKQPCQWCRFKKEICRPDHANNVVDISASSGVDVSKKLRGEYDFESTRKAVLDRWRGKKGVYGFVRRDELEGTNGNN